MNDNMHIAEQILQQLGGTNRLTIMTGAKDFMAIDNGVQFRIGGGANERINAIRIVLNSLDTYDVEFGRIYKSKGMIEYDEKQRAHGIYNDMLVSLIERTTGMYLSL